MARAYIAISVVTLCWAGNFTAAKICTREISPYFIASVRILATAALFWPLLPRAERRIVRGDWMAILPLALTGIGANHICFAAGMRLTTPSHSAVIHALIPVFVSIVAWIVLREKLAPAGVLGMALAVAGALVVVTGVTRQEIAGTILGDVITTVGILAFSIYTVYGRRVLSSMGRMRAIALAFLFASPIMVPVLVVGVLDTNWAGVTWKGWTSLAYMFVAANLIAYTCHIYALSHLKAGQVAAFTTLQPPIGIGVAVLAGVDHVTTSLLIGAGLALGGVVLVQLRR
jgi:drug/metabolite transporter (DMT)-like permease